MTKTAERAVREVWGKAPNVRCKGLCTAYCGPVGWSKPEADVMKRHHVTLPKPDREGTCSKLREGRCGIYRNRPLVCRLFGGVDSPLLECPHGCPVERVMSDAEAETLMNELLKIGG